MWHYNEMVENYRTFRFTDLSVELHVVTIAKIVAIKYLIELIVDVNGIACHMRLSQHTHTHTHTRSNTHLPPSINRVKKRKKNVTQTITKQKHFTFTISE